ncbi:acylneuraminate cytidylyltransferase family protein [Pseudoalteromonas sp. JC3]|uniref:acylneuraminate cytidylyltransferase family protein n=1 Tax=Pseudoalteromonas sp. JC3 TaxID=2810196 RepID=UPI0019D1C0C3|nr:acylneuraminate cytidylyltransferase family protein [Pseudoalteromonas sp. JC3]MBR8842647.1 acylneuraminate cytidylyltransferase family protein [Pseudoalteromonas sp. JC3]WJE10121.1 acylneuraminate cytidylyltransferase family protein [Pseudoalteromonas sp. JC3]
MDKVIAFTFARAGSKGVPNKNIRLLHGKPLLQYAIESAHACQLIDKHYVSTDGDAIKDIAKSLGCEIIHRPESLASDSASEWLAWQHAVQYLVARGEMSKSDIFVSVPCTSPLRTSADISSAIEAFLTNTCDLALGITEADHSPYFNMVKMDSEGVIETICGDETFTRRQEVPVSWNITTMVYVTTAEYILRESGVMDGRILGVKMPKLRAIDIDTEIDFEYAEFLLNR